MCGFVGAFDLNSGSQPIDQGLKEELRSEVLEMSRKIRHRGPDWTGVYAGNNAILSHERLAIVDPLSGKQPLVSDDGKIILAVNGEIYNHKTIRREFESLYNFKTQSDCEVIIPLYKKYGKDFLEKLSMSWRMCRPAGSPCCAGGSGRGRSRRSACATRGVPRCTRPT